jgi:hypothetical protein
MVNESAVSATSPARRRWGGIALMIGVLIFIGSRFRHLVDPTDRMLGALMVVAFVAWFLGLLALRDRYRHRSNLLGRVGLVLGPVAIVLVTVGHVAAFVFGFPGPWFVPIVLGTFLLVIGVLSFGIAALRGDVLPRWRVVPLVAGAVGLLWIVFAFDARPVEGNPEAFLLMRTAFGLCWLPLAYVLLTDRRRMTGAAPAKFEPYNAHSIRDIGAFQLGLGAVLLFGVWVRDALFAALAGVAVGAVAHVVAHVVDRQAGGQPGLDIPMFAILAILLVVAAIVRARLVGD